MDARIAAAAAVTVGSGSGGFRLRERLRSSLLVVPGGIVAVAVALAAGTVRLDRSARDSPLGAIFPSGSPASTSDLLATIAGAAVTLTALVFSITMLVLQLSSNQFSPRVLRTFLRDRSAQITLGVLAGTFAYSVIVLRALDVEAQQSAPPLSAGVAALFALLSLGVFVHYINHIAHKIRASSVLAAITDEGLRTLHHRFPTDPPPQVATPALISATATTVVTADGYGYVLAVATDGLVEQAAKHDAVIVVAPRVGDFVTIGSPLLEIHRGDGDLSKLRAAITLGNERTMEQDLAFAFRQLVDVVEKAMSPSMNDTTTAVQAVDHLRQLTRALAERHLPASTHCDDAGNLRVVFEPTRWDEYLHLAVTEVLNVSRDSPRIRAAVDRLLEDAASVALPERRADLHTRLRHPRT